MSLFLIRYAEIGLKSNRVRRRFINRLKEDMENKLMDAGIDHIVWEEGGRLLVETSFDHNAISVLKGINGIHSFSPVEPCGSSREDIMLCLERVGKKSISEKMSFGLKVKRIGSHPYSSRDIAINGGFAVLSHLPEGSNVVDLSNPDVWFEVEIRADRAYVFTERIRGKGGMPSSTQGRSILYLPSLKGLCAAEEEKLSIRTLISRQLLERRGVKVVPCCWSEDLDRWSELLSGGERPFYLEGEDIRQALLFALQKLDARAVIYPVDIEDISSFPLLHDRGEPVAALFPTAAMGDEELKKWSEFFGVGSEH